MRPLRLASCCLVGSLCLPALAQQEALHRFDLYAGFSDLNTPGLNNINEIGFHLQAGVVTSRWSVTGVDYSIQSGRGTLTPGLAPPALREELAATLPPGYRLRIPFNATTQTFTGGSMLVLHRHSAAFFVHPVIAAFRINATPRPDDLITTIVAATLSPKGSMTDWYAAFGAGGGVEFPVRPWLGARAQFDASWNHPFPNLVDHGVVSFRYSVGPAFHFGPTLHHIDHN